VLGLAGVAVTLAAVGFVADVLGIVDFVDERAGRDPGVAVSPSGVPPSGPVRPSSPSPSPSPSAARSAETQPTRPPTGSSPPTDKVYAADLDLLGVSSEIDAATGGVSNGLPELAWGDPRLTP
jgi:hypothetical protein